jgi:hypothetical protein
MGNLAASFSVDLNEGYKLRVHDNKVTSVRQLVIDRVLRKYLDVSEKKYEESRQSYIMRNFAIVTLHLILLR